MAFFSQGSQPADGFRREIVALLPRLRAFALSLTRNRDAADDLVQGACEKALAGQATFRPDGRLDSWLFRILHNLWIDGHRRRRPQETLDEPGLAEALAGEDPRPALESRSLLAATRQAIAALPEEQRAVLVLVCVEELSYREAAEVLGVPLGTIMSRLSRARRALAERVLDQDAAPGAAGAA